MFMGLPSKESKISARFIAKYSVVLLSVFIFHNVTAETPTSPESPLTHTLDTFELTLLNKNDDCQLQVSDKASDNKTIPLLLKSPCYWVTSSETKALLQYSYESVDADNTLLVAGTPLDWPAEKKSYQKLPNNAYCTQFLQGVIISKSKVLAVDEKMIAAHCETGLAIDEKIFYAMAHNPKRYQEKTISPSDTSSKDKKAATEAGKTLAKSPSSDTAKAPEAEEKSFLDSVTDTVKEFFSSDKDTK